MDNVLHITLFQKFSVTYQGIYVSSPDFKSDRLVRLMAYFVINHKRAIPSSELVDYIWNYESIENPIGALKNLIYRLRTFLKNQFSITDLIVTGKGTYSLNQNYVFDIDAETFEEYRRKLSHDDSLENFEKLFSLYRGKYFNEFKGDHGVIMKSEYYHSLLIEDVVKCSEILEKNHNYELMEELSRKAIELDNTEEKFHEILIRSLYFQKKYKSAQEVYKYTMDLLYHTIGVKPSDSMKELYDMIQKESHDTNMKLADLQKEFAQNSPTSAFLCDYGVFKEIYAMESRLIGRWGIPVHVCLITLTEHTNDTPDEELEKIMIRIQKALSSGLRIGDVISRLSNNQFIVLLLNCKREDCTMVFDRVLRKVQYSLNHKKFFIDVDVEEVMPQEKVLNMN